MRWASTGPTPGRVSSPARSARVERHQSRRPRAPPSSTRPTGGRTARHRADGRVRVAGSGHAHLLAVDDDAGEVDPREVGLAGRAARGLDGVLHPRADRHPLHPRGADLAHDVHDDDAGCRPARRRRRTRRGRRPHWRRRPPRRHAPAGTPTGTAPALTPVGPAREPPPGARTVPSPSRPRPRHPQPEHRDGEERHDDHAQHRPAAGVPARPDERAGQPDPAPRQADPPVPPAVGQRVPTHAVPRAGTAAPRSRGWCWSRRSCRR